MLNRIVDKNVPPGVPPNVSELEWWRTTREAYLKAIAPYIKIMHDLISMQPFQYEIKDGVLSPRQVVWRSQTELMTYEMARQQIERLKIGYLGDSP